MSNRENMGSNIEPGLVASVARGVRNVVQAVQTVWFGPGEPLQPIAQEAKGRILDYPYAANQRTTPRQGEGSPFLLLRGLADNCDILRLVIETRKDQLCRLDWQIVPRDKEKEQGADAKALEDFLRMPDREHTWDAWLRMLLEDLFVLDAPVLYPRRTKGGGLYALEPVDGATINRMLDGSGRTPLPPEAAYQQILKGMPAVSYTADELVYAPRNPRTHRVYGYSPVEQVVMTVNMAIRRALHQLQYYTEGSTPDLIWSVPESWNPDQIRQFQEFWDSMLAGNTAARRKGLFVPSGIKPVDTKENALKDEFDEWLARVVCFAFSIPPTPFVKQVNRATAQTAQEASVQEGLHPLMKWVCGLMDGVLAKHMGRPDLCFKWAVEEEVDALTKAQIHQIYLAAGVLDENEVREQLGLDALTPVELEARKPAPPVLPQDGPGGDEGDKPGDEPPKDAKVAQEGKDGEKAQAKGKAEKLMKAAGAKVLPAVPFDRPEVNRERKALEGALAGWLSGESKAVADEVQAAYEAHLGKADAVDDALLYLLLEAVDWSRWDRIIIIFEPHLEVVGDSTGLRALIGLTDDKAQLAQATPKVEDAAVTYAKIRAAEMVGKQYNALGELVPNPSPKWAITESTRASLRALGQKNLAEGADPRTLAQAIREATGFSAERAALIARTELLAAHNEANLASYRAMAGLGLDIRKQWVTAHDDLVSLDCVANEALGPLPLEEPFTGGELAPPCHPRCLTPETPVIATGIVAAFRAFYQGQVVKVRLSNGAEFTVTPNHLFLAPNGFTPAQGFSKGDKVFCHANADNGAAVKPDDNREPASIQDVFEAFAKSPGVRTIRVPAAPEYLHGDAGGVDGYIDVVASDSFLRGNVESSDAEHLGKGCLCGACDDCAGLAVERTFYAPLVWLRKATHGLVGGLSVSDVLGLGSAHHHQPVGFSDPTALNAHCVKPDCDGSPGNFEPGGQGVLGLPGVISLGNFNGVKPVTKPMALDAPAGEGSVNGVGAETELLREFSGRHAGQIELAEVVSVESFDFAGHVYDLHTLTSLYYVNTAVSSNCRCDLAPVVDFKEEA